MQNIDAYGYYLTDTTGTLSKKSLTLGEPAAHEVVVEVAGCGLCHTDLGFISGKVKTNTELPLILGHEISGEVISSGTMYESLVGKNVIIPAVLPCGECELCKNGRSNICRQQKMPGNDFHGGFASHIKVPGRFLCSLDNDLKDFKLAHLAVIADAVTTPYQSLLRSNLQAHDLAVVIGVGGIGIYMVQLAHAQGAQVIAVDIDDGKLAKAQAQGANFVINAREKSERDIKNEIRSLVKTHKLPKLQWKIFETSGTASGQSTAFSLLSFAGAVGIVGFTMDKVTIRLSNIMAFDADLFGNWGCKPEYYPAVVDKVLNREINIHDNIEEHPLDAMPEIVPLALQHKIEKRVIFIP